MLQERHKGFYCGGEFLVIGGEFGEGGQDVIGRGLPIGGEFSNGRVQGTAGDDNVLVVESGGIGEASSDFVIGDGGDFREFMARDGLGVSEGVYLFIFLDDGF